ARWQPGRHLRASLGYAWSRARAWSRVPVAQLSDPPEWTADMPRNVVSGALTWLATDFEAGVQAYHADRYRVRGIPSRDRIDLRLAWLPADGLELSGRVENLLDQRHVEYPQPGGATQPIGRSWYLQARWTH
ncbi:MAG: TonB-dependent receptor, partial [Planctomycetota bacterium]